MCDLGASVSTIPKNLCDLLDFRDFEDCSLNLHLAGSTIKKPMGRIKKPMGSHLHDLDLSP